jgi:hypothetical protein
VSTFTNFLRGRFSRASTSLNRKKTKINSTADSNNRDEQNDHHQHGAEGNAFQVNDQPEPEENKTDSHRHGAEGNAFQANNQPEQVGDKSDDAP